MGNPLRCGVRKRGQPCSSCWGTLCWGTLLTTLTNIGDSKLLLWSPQAPRSPPGNRLEKLTGDRIGQHSIRINDQWRICFRWRDGNAYDVEITDYH